MPAQPIQESIGLAAYCRRLACYALQPKFPTISSDAARLFCMSEPKPTLMVMIGIRFGSFACSACSFCCRCHIPIILLHFVFLQGHGRISSAQVCPNADLCRNHSTLHTTAPHISGSACSICRVAQVRTWHVLTCLLVRTCLCVVSCTYLGLYLWQAVSAYASEQWAV